jgi:hypothetical protein
MEIKDVYIESEACLSKLIILPLIPFVFYVTVVESIYTGEVRDRGSCDFDFIV